MKKNLLLFYFGLTVFVMQGQMPSIGTYTIIPQNPTTTSFIKIVTNVTTSNLSIIVDLNHTVTASQIRINGCYAQGMAAALQTHIDTFMIGQLAPGNYSIIQKAYLSAAQQWCNKTDSNSVSGSFNVLGPTTGLQQTTGRNLFRVYPNPAGDKLFIPKDLPGGELFIFSAKGELVLKSNNNNNNGEIDLKSLPDGLYLIKFLSEGKSQESRLIKSVAY